MILLCGIPSEGPLAMVASALDASQTPYRLLNQRKVADYAMEWRIEHGEIDGTLRLGTEAIGLQHIDAVYVRLMDDRLLPELEGKEDASPARRHSRGFHDALTRWMELAPGRIVNRAEPQLSNGSKPYQAQLIRGYGFQVPETLITNDPAAARSFREQHGAIIYKSISGVRSIVQQLEDADLDRIDDIRWCPVQFQALVPGFDVRVHVVGRDVHATRIDSDKVDYRYAKRHGGRAELSAIDLPHDVADRCIALAAGLGLAFAGIDLRHTPAGDWVCFEVNPSPAFSYYQANTEQPIAESVAAYLAA